MATSWQDWRWQDFVRLSYPTLPPTNPDSFHGAAYFNTGWIDVFVIITSIAVMAVMRDALRLGVLEPFARWKLMRDLKCRLASSKPNGIKAYSNGHACNGDRSIANGNGHVANDNAHRNGDAKPTTKQLRQVHRSVLRFAEQGWSVVYYTYSWCYGLYIHSNLPTRIFNPSAVWEGYPHIPLPGPVKFYYLMQTAFYLHQTLILNAEARRKDHVQMMVHHIITVGLLVLSYFTNFTRVGCIILLLMDTCDIFLPLAKMVRYIDVSQLATDVLFGFFMVSWLVTRHCLFLLVIWSTIVDGPRHIPFLLDPKRGFYFTRPAHIAFCTMLLALQILQCIWFWMICRVAYRVVTGDGAADERSDEEVDESDDKQKDD